MSQLLVYNAVLAQETEAAGRWSRVCVVLRNGGLGMSGEDANPLNRRLPAEVVTRQKRTLTRKDTCLAIPSACVGHAGHVWAWLPVQQGHEMKKKVMLGTHKTAPRRSIWDEADVLGRSSTHPTHVPYIA